MLEFIFLMKHAGKLVAMAPVRSKVTMANNSNFQLRFNFL